MISTSGGQDFGKDFENLVYLLLRRRADSISYWKGRGEVDFVVNGENGVTPIQVTYGEPQARHFEALEEFYQHFPHANEAVFVTADSLDELSDIVL